MKSIVRSPAILLGAAVILGIVGTLLATVTAVRDAGFTEYHPYDLLGIFLDLVAVIPLAKGLWRLFRR